MQIIRRGGDYYRVADPDWTDPLDGSWSMKFGGRWNPAGSFPVVYLNRDRPTARANARFLLTKKLASSFLLAEDLDTSELPVLVTAVVLDDEYVDVISDNGCADADLPVTYPYDNLGNTIEHSVCQPIGMDAWREGRFGIACRTAVDEAPAGGEELAYFDRPGRRLTASQPTENFEDWYGFIDW